MSSQIKVAIPRLQRPGHMTSASRGGRVLRACTACRDHKIKCTGDTPRCNSCEFQGRECIYILPRRDKLRIATDHCVQMATLLRDMKSRASEDDCAKINALLGAVEEDLWDPRQVAVAIPDADHEPEDHKGPSDTISNASLDPMDTESFDLLDEDLTRDERARATGFVGKNSEVQWLRSIKLQLDRIKEEPDQATLRCASPGTIDDLRGSYGSGSINQINSFTFYLDNESVDPDFYISLPEMPAPDTAERLLSCYMATVHDSFPILSKRPFEVEFRKYFEAVKDGRPPRLTPKWQAILNLVFAIGAKYSHLVKARWRADEQDHFIYHTRARAFGLNELALTSHPDVPQIQVSGLLAFYYLSIGQISRAWIVMGMALRFAYALGLHVRNEDPTSSSTKKEALVRMWWGLYSLEHLLSAIAGRPSIIVDSYCSVPLPIPFPVDQLYDDRDSMDQYQKFHSTSPVVTSPTSTSSMDVSTAPAQVCQPNTGSYFKALVQISIITQNIPSALYSAGTMIKSWEEIQQSVTELTKRLDHWVLALPAEFNFQQQHSRSKESDLESQTHTRERMLLGFYYFSAKILLTRPCLGRLGQGSKGNMTDTYVCRMTQACIDAAKATANILPDCPDPLFLYQTGPWWSIVHNIMQAISAFLLRLSYCSSGSQDTVVLVQYVKKLLRWLRAMQDNNALAERAYQVAFGTLEAVAARTSIDISDLLGENAMEITSPSMFGGAQTGMHSSNTDSASQSRFPGIPGGGYGDSFMTEMGPQLQAQLAAATAPVSTTMSANLDPMERHQPNMRMDPSEGGTSFGHPYFYR
ncbi:hypothetical protein K469DRAFT_559877 [Zopfia rhizophila CBS 207.26]|uniref:Zn(2)-C6 fungal-type domain-containing protein n=1 Tax=Zopfia rhizophila CBS 207.26 TaxID=1314779 RepID=A0A6A6EKK8_9PEZI|nr:hypothetical protein K469DRAFT_559877 [Zopfia rhizophila CBS 207.26]